MLPLYAPGARPAGLTETLKLTFPVPDAGVTASHAPPVLVPALAVKLSVTATVCATSPVGVTVMLPLYAPGARPAGLTETLKLTFPVPDAGVTASHAPPVLVPALAVKLC